MRIHRVTDGTCACRVCGRERRGNAKALLIAEAVEPGDFHICLPCARRIGLAAVKS
jgi:hypothetical protein